jgi:hypothetical protein
LQQKMFLILRVRIPRNTNASNATTRHAQNHTPRRQEGRCETPSHSTSCVQEIRSNLCVTYCLDNKIHEMG